VTLSNPDVKKALAPRFVLATLDSTGDPESGESIRHAPDAPGSDLLRGNGEHNLQLLFLTPQGEILHALAGYVSAQELLVEIELALKLHEALRSPSIDRTLLVRTVHATAGRADARAAVSPGPFSDWERRRRVADHRFVERHPLLSAAAFRPSLMVGAGASFFADTQGGASPDWEDLLRRVGLDPR
jgi:hypothetical protein